MGIISKPKLREQYDSDLAMGAAASQLETKYPDIFAERERDHTDYVLSGASDEELETMFPEFYRPDPAIIARTEKEYKQRQSSQKRSEFWGGVIGASIVIVSIPLGIADFVAPAMIVAFIVYMARQH